MIGPLTGRALDVFAGGIERIARFRFDRFPLSRHVGGAVPAMMTTATDPSDSSDPSDPSTGNRGSDLSASLAAGVRAGFGAAVVMDVPMVVQREGFTPAYIAAGALRGRDPEEVSRTDATVAHHGAGTLGGVLFALTYGAIEGISTGEPRRNDLSTPASPLAVGFVVAFVYGFFARLVLPRFGGDARDRAGVVRRAWLVSTLVYGAALAAFVSPVARERGLIEPLGVRSFVVGFSCASSRPRGGTRTTRPGRTLRLPVRARSGRTPLRADRSRSRSSVGENPRRRRRTRRPAHRRRRNR